MMDSPRTGKPQVMIGSNGVGHIQVCTGTSRQVQRTANDARNMFHVMSLVEGRITGKDLSLNKLNQVE